MDDTERLYTITEGAKFERLIVKSITFGVLGFIAIVTTAGYSCNHDDDVFKTRAAQAEVEKAQSSNAVEKAKAEAEKAQLDLNRAVIESATKLTKE